MNLHKWKDIDRRGTVEKLTYVATTENGNRLYKYANIYLPYGYTPEKKYNVLYLMHGGGGNPDAWLDCSQIKNVFDQAFIEGRTEPFITVFPTFYNSSPQELRRNGINHDAEISLVLGFQKELREHLIPAVETKYSTYADGVDTEALEASRKHRAFGGFSMGGGTTWFAFLHNLDIIANFMPLSGDCWALDVLGGKTKTKETAKYLHDYVMDKRLEFHIYSATGSKDLGDETLTPMITEMLKYPDAFLTSDDLGWGNVHHDVQEEFEHAYEAVYHYVNHYIAYLFKW